MISPYIISAFLPDWNGRKDDPVPSDLIGAQIIAFGMPEDRDRLEGGGLLIVYIPKGHSEPKRMDFEFTELGMWLSDRDKAP